MYATSVYLLYDRTHLLLSYIYSLLLFASLLIEAWSAGIFEFRTGWLCDAYCIVIIYPMYIHTSIHILFTCICSIYVHIVVICMYSIVCIYVYVYIFLMLVYMVSNRVSL